MANISKNIKRLRSEKKLTQEQLAAQLNVTRQTISSWENDRTQPDIDMLAALAGALDAEIEDLIYGKKKHVGLEADPGEKRKTLSTVLVITGSLLFAVGVVFLFVYFWEKLPSLMKTVLSLLPLFVGAGAGLFAVVRKKRSIAFRETAAVLWFAGVIATFALINSLFSVDFGFSKLLAADVLLLLPVPFLLDSVFAFTAEVFLTQFLLSRPMVDGEPYRFFFIGLAAFAVCAVYVFRNGQSKPVKQYCAWMGLLGAAASATIGCWMIAERPDVTTDSFLVITAVPVLFFTALYIAGKGKLFGLSFRFPAALILLVALPVFTAVSFADDVGEFLPFDGLTYLAVLLWAAVCAAFAAAARRADETKSDALRKALAAVFAGFCVMLLLFGLPEVVTLLFSVAAGVITIMIGVKRSRLLVCNLGMLQLAANVFILLVDISSADLLWIGALFVVMGGVILAANKIMSKKFEARKAAAQAAAQAETETEGTENA